MGFVGESIKDSGGEGGGTLSNGKKVIRARSRKKKRRRKKIKIRNVRHYRESSNQVSGHTCVKGKIGIHPSVPIEYWGVAPSMLARGWGSACPIVNKYGSFQVSKWGHSRRMYELRTGQGKLFQSTYNKRGGRAVPCMRWLCKTSRKTGENTRTAKKAGNAGRGGLQETRLGGHQRNTKLSSETKKGPDFADNFLLGRRTRW